MSNFVAGLLILRDYYKTPDTYSLAAEHDIFYLMATDRPLPTEAVEKLIELGWFQEGRASGEKFAVCDYDPGESWAAFT